MYTTQSSFLKICLSVALLALWTGGCSSNASHNDAIHETAETLDLRYEAAIKIQNPALADQALRGIARDAADADLEDICQSAVEKIKTEDLRSDTAHYSALAFWHGGNRQGAINLAMQMHEGPARDELLKKFAGPMAPNP